MRRPLLHALPLILMLTATPALVGCGGEEVEEDVGAEVPVDTITQRPRDSAVGASGLPGAGGVRRAIDASDAAESRAAAMDSISGGR